MVDGVCGINLCNIGGYILIDYFYNKPLLKWMGELLWLFDIFLNCGGWPLAMPTQVLYFSCYGYYKSRNRSRINCPLPPVLLPYLYVLTLTNTLPTNGYCFPPVYTDVPSARRTYCPLLSYTISLPLPLKMPNGPQKTVLVSSYLSCSYLINVA